MTYQLPFNEWTEVLGSDHLTHHVYILGMTKESYLLKRSRKDAWPQAPNEE